MILMHLGIGFLNVKFAIYIDSPPYQRDAKGSMYEETDSDKEAPFQTNPSKVIV